MKTHGEREEREEGEITRESGVDRGAKEKEVAKPRRCDAVE